MSENIIKKIYEYPEINSQECIIRQWTRETDFDDYIECTFGYLHYKLINELLLLINSYNFFDLITIITQKKSNSKFLINQFTQMCSTLGKEITECIYIHFINIIKLYEEINKQIDFNSYYRNLGVNIDNKDLHLYRGFNPISDTFFDIIEKSKIITDEIDDVTGINKFLITTPTFLSTSVISNIAKRFLNKNEQTPVANKIMWKIIVPNAKLSEFNYIYFGDTIKIKNYNMDEHKDAFEFLLNIGALLLFINSETIINEHYIDISQPNGIKISYTLQTYEFVGWNYNYYEYINKTSKYFIKLFSSSKHILRSSSRH
jgi:hypothetical protein